MHVCSPIQQLRFSKFADSIIVDCGLCEICMYVYLQRGVKCVWTRVQTCKEDVQKSIVPFRIVFTHTHTHTHCSPQAVLAKCSAMSYMGC